MRKEKILILMSTYNGEKYLSEQLDSIAAQIDVETHILVRDDGSNDATISLLEAFKERHIIPIDIITGENIGWRKSFFSLLQTASLKYTDFRYYAFADQDDVWLPEKLIRAITQIKDLPEGPALYCSNQIYFKDGIQYGLIRPKHIVNSPKSALIRNRATGCTEVFNKSLLDLAAKDFSIDSMPHDYWCYILANLCGNVTIDDEAFILYRQHSGNQIGSKTGVINVWKRRLKSIHNLIGNHDREKLASELLRVHSDSISSEGYEAATKIMNYRNSIKSRLDMLCDNQYTFNKVSNDMWLKIRIILGRL